MLQMSWILFSQLFVLAFSYDRVHNQEHRVSSPLEIIFRNAR